MMRRSKETSNIPFQPSRAVIESKIAGGPLISALSTSGGGTAQGPVRRLQNPWDDEFVPEILPTKGSSLARRNAVLVQEVVRLRELTDRLSKGLQEQRRVTFAVETFKGKEHGKSDHVKSCDVETQTDTVGSIAGHAVSNASTQTSRSQTRSRSMCSSPLHEHNSPISLNLSIDRTGRFAVDGAEEVRGRPMLKLPFQPPGRERDESPLSLSPTSPHTPFDARVPSPSSSSVYSDDEGTEGIFSPYPLRREARCRSLRLSLQKLLRPESVVTPVSHSSSSSPSPSSSSLLSHHHHHQQQQHTPLSSATTLSSLTDSGFLSESPGGGVDLALELKNEQNVMPAAVKRGSQHSRKQLDSLQNLKSQEKR